MGGAVAAQAATATALTAGSATASFSAVTGYGTATTVTTTAATVATVVASSAKLAKNMINSGISRPAQTAAHHIVAGTSKFANEARAILNKFGVGINDAVNGVFLPQNLQSSNPTDATVHSTLHTAEYYKMVTDMLSTCSSKQEVVDTLNNIAKMLLNGEW